MDPKDQAFVNQYQKKHYLSQLKHSIWGVYLNKLGNHRCKVSKKTYFNRRTLQSNVKKTQKS